MQNPLIIVDKKLNSDLNLETQEVKKPVLRKWWRWRKSEIVPFYRKNNTQLRDILTEYIEKNKICKVQDFPLLNDDHHFTVA